MNMHQIFIIIINHTQVCVIVSAQTAYNNNIIINGCLTDSLPLSLHITVSISFPLQYHNSESMDI